MLPQQRNLCVKLISVPLSPSQQFHEEHYKVCSEVTETFPSENFYKVLSLFKGMRRIGEGCSFLKHCRMFLSKFKLKNFKPWGETLVLVKK